MRCHSLIGVRSVSTCGDIVTKQGEKGGTENQSPSGVRYVSIWGRKIFAVTGPGQVRRASVEGMPQCGQPECSEGVHAKGGPAWMGCQPRQGEKCVHVGVGDTSQCGVSQPEKIEVLCARRGRGVPRVGYQSEGRKSRASTWSPSPSGMRPPAESEPKEGRESPRVRV